MLTKDEFLTITYDFSKHRYANRRSYASRVAELNEFIQHTYPGASIQETAFLLLNNLDKRPTCKICDKPAIFYKDHYTTYCSKSCASSDHDVPQEEPDKAITKEAVIETFMKDGKFITQKLSDKYLKKHGWWNPLLAYYPDTTSCFETIYRLVNDLTVRPVCETCGGPLKFDYDFPHFCSNRCASTNPAVLAKNAAAVSKALKNAYESRGDEIKAKRQATLKETLGVDSCSPFASKDIQEKAKQTIFEHFGVDNIYKLPEIHKKSIEAILKKAKATRLSQGYDVEYVEKDGKKMVLIKNGCPVHGDILIDWSIFNNRTKADRRNLMVLCPQCNPLRNPETSIETAVKKMLDEFGVTYEQHDHKQIKPKELDFWLPDYKIGIECNGIWWHQGEEAGDKMVQKRQLCKEAGIRLLVFWEDEIWNKTDIVRSYLQSVLGKNKRVFARKCSVRELDSKTSREFIDENHLQGNIYASVKLGLFYGEELVEVMTFGKLRKCLGSSADEGVYELYRLCTKGGLSVVGGAGKLLKHFCDNYGPKKIVTYCSNDISLGRVYEKIGFKFVKDCGRGFWYINRHSGERKSRFALRKDVVDDGSGRTEVEINTENGWIRCYDCGNSKYEWLNC